MTTTSSNAERVWTAIEQDKRRDRRLRLISAVAWTVTIVLVLAFAALTAFQAAEMMRAVDAGVLPLTAVVGSFIPLILVMGLLSVLVATLSTIGIFLRLRTASLNEIQLRLAGLEETMRGLGDSGR
jgi:hypothetical protein